MTDLPIAFTEPMIRALWLGAKTQTRRVGARAKLLRPGDRLWVREPFHLGRRWDLLKPTNALADAAQRGLPVLVDYPADGQPPASAGRRRYAREMPRACHRMHLVLTAVREQRLQAIDDDDARAEGAADRDGFIALWDSIHADLAYRIDGQLHCWADNPPVVALTFTTVLAPIGASEALAA